MGVALPRTSPSSHAATGTVEPASPAVLDNIDLIIGPVPRVLLRDTGPGETPGLFSDDCGDPAEGAGADVHP
jgi:hypothetical protein